MAHTYIARVGLLALLVGSLLALGGCEEKVTQENFDKIEVGMTLQAVELILGEGNLEESSGTSIGTAGIPERSSDDKDDRTYAWEEGNKIITVRIIDDKVSSKRKVGW